nr:hypothetical protein [alfalfa-associated nucleorhabdovirus]
MSTTRIDNSGWDSEDSMEGVCFDIHDGDMIIPVKFIINDLVRDIFKAPDNSDSIREPTLNNKAAEHGEDPEKKETEPTTHDSVHEKMQTTEPEDAAPTSPSVPCSGTESSSSN